MSNSNRNTISLFTFSLTNTLLSVRYIVIFKELSSLFTQRRMAFHLSISNVFLEVRDIQVRCYFSILLSYVKVEHMVGDASINSIVSDILNDKDCIKSRQDCRLEVDLLSCVFQIIISTKNGISCSQY